MSMSWESVIPQHEIAAESTAIRPSGRFGGNRLGGRLRRLPSHKGSGNVFLDRGLDPAEAMIRMERQLKSQDWTPAEAAKRLGMAQPRVSRR